MAAVLGAFVPDTAVRWRGVVAGEVARRMGVAAEAGKLAARLERVGAAAADAEARAARGDEAAARWLANVRAAAYEADGAVDRCRVAARRRRVREQQQNHNQHQHQHRSQVLPRLLSSCCDTDEPHRDIAADIRNLNRKLKVILKEQHQLQLQLRSTLSDHHTMPLRKPPRHRGSKKNQARDIVGARIDDDASWLVRRLMETDGQAQAGCAVVAIVGPDGIGKTTLARKVFGSERIWHSFEARSWVRVGRAYTEAGLLSQLVDSLDGDTTGGESAADLGWALRRLVEKKRLLLVLDDVWYGGVWEDVLRSPLQHCGRGSKVLVTARHGSIAREMGAGHVHRVKRLATDDGWLLLHSAACVPEETEAGGGLKDVGEAIVEKCGGVPLAIKAVAGVLRARDASAHAWTEVLDSPAWSVKGLPDDAMKPLYMCYDDLPCHLKQCFLYCSLIPSDLAVDRRELVQQWIAEGYAHISADAGAEEVAGAYYDELIGRHLLEPEEEEDDHGGATRCAMHDMMRALAQLLSQGEDLTGDEHRLSVDGDGSFAPRRVSFPRRNLTAIPEKILKLQGVRTLLLQRNPLTIEGSIFTRLQHLKVLDLSETAVEVIPENLGNLVYLRFLNLSHTMIQAIPESIGNLWSLKFLLLRECKSLHALPKGIEHLRGLRDLDIAGTVIDDAAFRVGHLRSLTSLRFLSVVSKEERAAQDRSGWPLDELKNLSQLRTLHIQKLEKVAAQSEVTGMALAEKKCLRELELSCSSTASPFHSPEMIRKIEDIFEEMNPPLCLESLKIVSYFGTTFPRWLSETSLPNLRCLDIIGCNLCHSLPPLGRMPELRSLCIADCSALRDIGVEFMGKEQHHQVPFPKLENLHLQGLQKLETWTDIEAGALPSLQSLQLESCHKLRHLPACLGHATSLTELRIVDMASLQAVENVATLRELSVWNTPKLRRISNMPSLEDLNMCHCPMLETVENVDGLRAVHIFDHELQEMPRWIGTYASRLQSLNFTSTVELLKRCLVDGPDWPAIKDIMQVHGYSTGSSYIYYTKSPYIFESNVSIEEHLDVEGNAAYPDAVDEVSVSASGTGYLKIRGFFDSDVLKTGTSMIGENVSGRNMVRSIPRLTRRRMHKLIEVIPEEDEFEDGADSAVPFPTVTTRASAAAEKLRPVATDGHTDSGDSGRPSKALAHESRAITNDEIGRGNIARSVSTRRSGSETENNVPYDTGSDADTSVIKFAAAVGHNLVRQGSRAISITETDKDFNISTVQSKEHKSKKAENSAADSDNSKDARNGPSPRVSIDVVHKVSVSESDTKHVTFSIRNVYGGSEAKISTGSAPTEVKDRRSIPVGDHIDKRNQTATSTNGSTKTVMPSNTSGEEVSKESGGVTDSSLIHERSQTVSVTETIQDKGASSLRSEKQLSTKEKEVSEALEASAVDKQDNHKEDGNTSSQAKLNHEESKAIEATGTTCYSGSCKLPTSLAGSGEQTQKTPQTVSADPVDGTDASMKKIISMASKISQQVSSKCTVGSVKDPSAETAKNIARFPSKPECTMPHAIDTNEAPMKAEGSAAGRFPTMVAVNGGRNDDDPHQAPKVYTAAWADTDTDTLRARFVDSMRYFRRVASRRHHHRRHRKHGPGNRWSVGPALAAVLLLVSVVQLLFILWLYRRLLNQI
ncbi:hypothetical protein ACP70R_019252 [Stipagrostis hirtigluma subsp. patula]